MLNIPKSLISALNANPMPEIDQELPPIWLAQPAVLDKMQIGYRIHGITGEDLSSADEGAWQPEWLVIGEGLCGDPLFVNVNEAEQGFPVYTAENGTGYWEAEKVANSIASFVKIIGVLNEKIQDEVFDVAGFLRDIEYLTDTADLWEECAEAIIELREGQSNDNY